MSFTHTAGRILSGPIYCMSPEAQIWGLKPLGLHEVGAYCNAAQHQRKCLITLIGYIRHSPKNVGFVFWFTRVSQFQKDK